MLPVEKLERRHPDLLFTESEATGVYYATCEEKRMTIIVQHEGGPDQAITLDIGQAYAVAKELKDILFLIGRKKPSIFRPGRPRKNRKGSNYESNLETSR